MRVKEISVLSHSSKRASRGVCICSNYWQWNWGTRKNYFRELRFHSYFLGLLNAFMNSSGVSSLITDKSPVAAECSCWTLSFYLLPNLSYVTLPSTWNILFLISIFSSVLLFCCLCPGICTAVSRLWPVFSSVPLPYQQVESQSLPPLLNCLLFKNCFDTANTELVNKEH